MLDNADRHAIKAHILHHEASDRLMSSAPLATLRWPMLFKLQDCDAGLAHRSTHHFDMFWDYDAAPDIVHRTFFGFLGEGAWSPGFIGVEWLTPVGELDSAVMDELYSFMSMRVRVIEHIPGTRSVAVVERWSLPLATEMIQFIETAVLPSGKTRLRYRVHYNVPRVFWPFHPPVAAAFRAWFKASFRGLERYLAERVAQPAVGGQPLGAGRTTSA